MRAWPCRAVPCGLLGSFFCGGVAGVLRFQVLGWVATVPPALLLCGLAVVPAVDDLAPARQGLSTECDATDVDSATLERRPRRRGPDLHASSRRLQNLAG